MRFEGTLTSWNDQRGFGFIQPTRGGEPVYVHITSFTVLRGRPELNQRLLFEVQTNKQGQKRAVNVQVAVMVQVKPAQQRRRTEMPASWTVARALAVPAFITLLITVSALWKVPVWLPGVYVGLSVITFMVYAFDKAAAKANRWRTPENTLHILALLGGWPGALLAQQLLRHKSAKVEFRQVFWATVVLNVAGFLVWLTPLAQRFAIARI